MKSTSRLGGMATANSGNVCCSFASQQARGEIAQGSEVVSCIRNAYCRGIYPTRQVADTIQLVLDVPVFALDRHELYGSGAIGGNEGTAYAPVMACASVRAGQAQVAWRSRIIFRACGCTPKRDKGYAATPK